MIETVRARLTLWYVTVLAAALLVVGGLIYVLLARALYARIDDNLQARRADRDDLAGQRSRRRAGHRGCGAGAPRRSCPRGSRCWPSTTARAGCWRKTGATTTSTFALPPLDTIPDGRCAAADGRRGERRGRSPPAGVRRVTIPSVGTELHRRRRQLARADRRGAGVAARDPRLRRADRAGHRRHRRLVPGAPEPVAGRRDGRARAARSASRT